MAAIHSFADYSQTQRVVLLIDLNPILYLQDPNPYISSILSTARTILNFPPISSSLFSFKPFVSSLSPLLSSSKLSIPSFSLSFNRPSSTLDSLARILDSVVSTLNRASMDSQPARASLLAASMRELVHDYAWDSVISDSISGMFSNCDSFVKSNLVVLLSPIVRSSKSLADFFDVESNDECLRNVDCFVKKFRGLFESVNDAFLNRDIHFSWVDLKYEIPDCVKTELDCGFFVSGIRDFGWGFCSSESIVLGSAIVPFGLIYPQIGISPRFGNSNRNCESIKAQLSLEIVDVSGKPLECKFCDLQFFDLVVPSGITYLEQKKTIWGDFSHGTVNIQIKAVQRNDQSVKFDCKFEDPVIVQESSGHSEKGQKENCSEYFEDRVLDILSREKGEMVPRKSVPIWQILLSFLYRENYLALVSISNSNGDSLAGVMNPFTVSSALLSIVEDSFRTRGAINESNGSEKPKPEFDISCFKLAGKPADAEDRSLKKNKRNLNTLLQLKWSDFCKAAFDNLVLNLEDVYFARASNKSKKMKFLKCWMKQIVKSDNFIFSNPEISTKHPEVPQETNDRLTEFNKESEQPFASCSSAGDNSLTGASRVQDDNALDFSSETLESFVNNLPQRIQQGLESEEFQLESLANRLVNSSIYWLYRKYEMESLPDSQTPIAKSDDSSSNRFGSDLTKLLLKDPKDLAATEATSGNIVRQYELQILFRLELLQSEIGATFGESTKQKFIKQICLLLENIQLQLQGGFFGDWSLDKYVSKIIKSRYCDSLGDMVQKIYTKMDLLLFEDEDESLSSFHSNDDSHQSLKEKNKKDNTNENRRTNKSVSVDFDPTLQATNQVNAQIIEAQQRRERARRFASFTSWVPDLRRVWAPKQQQKGTNAKTNLSRNLSKRKEHCKISEDTVCETPMSGFKRSCSRESRNSEDDSQDSVFSGSVSKALFQDD